MFSNNSDMLLQNGISTERVALILKRYERRLENNKKWAKDYYDRQFDMQTISSKRSSLQVWHEGDVPVKPPLSGSKSTEGC